jgi:hypothetical protein
MTLGVHPIYASMDASIIAEYQRVCADRDKYLSWHQTAESEAERFQFAIEEAQRILTTADAMYEDTDSPGNMAWAILTHALEKRS